MKSTIVLFICLAFVAISWAQKHNHGYAVQKLANEGISVYSSGSCSDRNNPRCTSLEQVNVRSIDYIISFKKVSNCGIIVTGGTETGHASGTHSHWNGYKIDLDRRTCTDNYVTGNYPYVGSRPDGTKLYKSPAGYIWANEGNHWDVLIA